MKLKKILYVPVFAVSMILLFLFAVPVLSASDADADAKEIKLGEKVSRQIEEQWERVGDPVRSARISMILNRLLPYTERDLPFEVRIIEEKRPNAFALPGGIIYFTSGMLDFCMSDDEIAAVIGHELVHADKRHVMTQVARNQRLSLGALVIIIATRGQGAAPILANLAQVAIMNSYSRDLEREADLGGLHILQQAGYEPAASVTVMERLREDEMKRPYTDPGIFAGHPKTRERVSEIINMIRDKNWPLRRKNALHLLRTDVLVSEGKLLLTVDGIPVWYGPGGDRVSEILLKAKNTLDDYLQMEISPFEIMILDSNGDKTLKIGLGTVAAAGDVLSGMPSLEVLRENLLGSLHRARSIHPIADYSR